MASKSNSVAGETSTMGDDTMNYSVTQKSSRPDGDQLVDSISRSQLPNYFNRGGQDDSDEAGMPESAAGQGRQFYYGADEQSVTVKSKDFDDVYDVSGQSQILRDLEQSQRPRTGMTEDSQGKKRAFGREEENGTSSDLGSSQVMLEDSSGSLVNMAISLDPLSANKALGHVDQKLLQKQKQAMAPLVDKFLPSASANKTGNGSTTPTGGDYSADEFEDDDEQAPVAVDKGLTDKYVVSMEAPAEDEEDEALQALQDTSKFGGGPGLAGADDGQEEGDDSFDAAFEKGDESQPPREEEELEDFMAKPKPKRPQWGQQSFGAPTNQDDEDNNSAEDDAAATLPGQRRK